MKFKTLHARNPNLTTAEVCRIERLEQQIRLILAVGEARGRVKTLLAEDRAAEGGARALRKEARRAIDRVKREKAVETVKHDAPGLIVPAPVLLRRLGLAPGSVLPFDHVPRSLRNLAVGESAGSDWNAETTARTLPAALYQVDPGPPVMVTRIAPDPTEPELDVPAGDSSAPAAGAQVAPETAPA